MGAKQWEARSPCGGGCSQGAPPLWTQSGGMVPPIGTTDAMRFNHEPSGLDEETIHLVAHTPTISK